MKWLTLIVIVPLLGGVFGCQSLGLTTSPTQTTVQSQVFAWDDANATRTKQIVDQLKKNWAMNSAAIKELIGPAIAGEQYFALNDAITKLDAILAKEVLTQEDYGRGIILFGKFLDAGGRAVAANVIPRAIALYAQLTGR